MNKKSCTLQSSSDGLILDAIYMEPAETVKASVVIVHGMTEHKERYLSFMEFLCQRGYAVMIYDQRGHGNSVRSDLDLGYFYEDDAAYILQDIQDAVLFMKRQNPQCPLYLFAHSMGTLEARLYLKDKDDQIDKLVLSGAVAQNGLVDLALVLTKFLKFHYGDRHRSKLIHTLAFGGYDRSFTGDQKNRWLSEDLRNVLTYNEHPKDGFVFTLNGFRNLFLMVKRTYDPKGWQVKNPHLPIFFVAGKEDPVIGSRKQWDNARQFLSDCGYDQISSKLYDHMRHEILQETKKDIVMNDILEFFES